MTCVPCALATMGRLSRVFIADIETVRANHRHYRGRCKESSGSCRPWGLSLESSNSTDNFPTRKGTKAVNRYAATGELVSCIFM